MNIRMIALALSLLIAGITALPLNAEGPKNVYVGLADCVLPQVADGGNWSTRITLVNMDDTAAEFTLRFYRTDGQPWAITLKGQGTASQWQGTIPVGSSLFLETTGTDALTTSGWAYLDTWDRIGGMAVFKAGWLATHDMEAVVPFASEYDDEFYMPFDNRTGYVTSLALVNPSTYSSAKLTVEFRDPLGNRLILDQVTLKPLEHMAFSTTERYPALLGKHGVIEFGTPDWGVAALGLLFNPRHSFTSIHALSR